MELCNGKSPECPHPYSRKEGDRERLWHAYCASCEGLHFTHTGFASPCPRWEPQCCWVGCEHGYNSHVSTGCTKCGCKRFALSAYDLLLREQTMKVTPPLIEPPYTLAARIAREAIEDADPNGAWPPDGPPVTREYDDLVRRMNESVRSTMTTTDTEPRCGVSWVLAPFKALRRLLRSLKRTPAAPIVIEWPDDDQEEEAEILPKDENHQTLTPIPLQFSGSVAMGLGNDTLFSKALDMLETTVEIKDERGKTIGTGKVSRQNGSLVVDATVADSAWFDEHRASLVASAPISVGVDLARGPDRTTAVLWDPAEEKIVGMWDLSQPSDVDNHGSQPLEIDLDLVMSEVTNEPRAEREQQYPDDPPVPYLCYRCWISYRYHGGEPRCNHPFKVENSWMNHWERVTGPMFILMDDYEGDVSDEIRMCCGKMIPARYYLLGESTGRPVKAFHRMCMGRYLREGRIVTARCGRCEWRFSMPVEDVEGDGVPILCRECWDYNEDVGVYHVEEYTEIECISCELPFSKLHWEFRKIVCDRCMTRSWTVGSAQDLPALHSVEVENELNEYFEKETLDREKCTHCGHKYAEHDLTSEGRCPLIVVCHHASFMPCRHCKCLCPGYEPECSEPFRTLYAAALATYFAGKATFNDALELHGQKPAHQTVADEDKAPEDHTDEELRDILAVDNQWAADELYDRLQREKQNFAPEQLDPNYHQPSPTEFRAVFSALFSIAYNDVEEVEPEEADERLRSCLPCGWPFAASPRNWCATHPTDAEDLVIARAAYVDKRNLEVQPQSNCCGHPEDFHQADGDGDVRCTWCVQYGPKLLGGSTEPAWHEYWCWNQTTKEN